MSTYIADRRVDRRVANSRPVFLELRKSAEEKQRWGYFVASYAGQIIALTAILIYSMLGPRLDPAPFRQIGLVAPELETAPAKAAKPVRQSAKLAPAPEPVVLKEALKIQPPPVEARQPERMHHAVQVAEVTQPQLVAAPKFDSKLLNAARTQSR